MRTRALLLGLVFLAGCLGEETANDFVWQQRAPLPGADEFDPPPAKCASFTSDLEITDTFGQPATTFIQGERINVRMLVQNVSDESRVLTIPSGCPAVHFEVVNAANEVVVGSGDGFACTLMQVQVEHGPGEATLHTWDWGQSMRNSEAAPIGDYTVYADERTECRFALSKSATISIQ